MKRILALVLLLPSLALADTSTTDLPLDPASNLLSIEFGALANKQADDDFDRYSGIGLRYAREIGGTFLSVQNSLELEGSVFLYRVVNYSHSGDDFTVLPVSLVAKLGRTYHEVFRPYCYAGAMKNFGIVQRGAVGSDGSNLSSLQPALGVGLSVSFKGVIARADIGTDLIGAGLAYGF